MPDNRARSSTERLHRLLKEPSLDRVRPDDSPRQYLARVLLAPVAKGTRLVTDGPFAETREVLGG
jgi:hypothetical protein